MKVSKALKIHDRQRKRAELKEEKRGVGGIDKEDKGRVQCSLVKHKQRELRKQKVEANWGESNRESYER